jgi:hypothetical protein
MEIRYEVEDGYAGGHRWKYVEVYDEDLEQCETMEEKIKLIDEAVEEHFSQNIYPVWDRSQIK